MNPVSIRLQGATRHDVAAARDRLATVLDLDADTIRPRRDRVTGEPFIHRYLTATIPDSQRPPITVICGSTRFMQEMADADRDLTWAGHIVVRPGCNMKEPHPLWGDEAEAEAGKIRLDELHRAKIRLADAVLVVGDYIGDSTRAEIAYARALSKPVQFTHPEVNPDRHGGQVSRTPTPTHSINEEIIMTPNEQFGSTPSTDGSTQLGRLRTYLEAQDWRRGSHSWRGATVWTHASGQVVSVPDTVEHDVELRVLDAIEGIARAERRRPSDVAFDLEEGTGA